MNKFDSLITYKDLMYVIRILYCYICYFNSKTFNAMNVYHCNDCSTLDNIIFGHKFYINLYANLHFWTSIFTDQQNVVFLITYALRYVDSQHSDNTPS